MTQFCHITPTAYLDTFARNRPSHLVLAHLIEKDEAYANWYANRKDGTVIMDNSAFEMYKEGREMYPSSKLAEMAARVKADYVVLTDHPGKPRQVTQEASEHAYCGLVDAGYEGGTFYCPQSEIGNRQELIEAFQWAADQEWIDYIGVSILAVPNAYGVEKDNKLQRFLSRWQFMHELDVNGILQQILDNEQKIHFLGMVDGPNEIALVERYLSAIDTWDSSAAVWAGLNNIAFDDSPSGLINGKFEKEVDFSHNTATLEQLNIARDNCSYIDCVIEAHID